MKPIDVFVLVLTIALFTACIVRLVRDKRNGCSSCAFYNDGRCNTCGAMKKYEKKLKRSQRRRDRA
jgi:hypothetical protein